MSFKAKLKVGGKELNVLNCSYDLEQKVDFTGRPSSEAQGGLITLKVESTGDSFFFEWVSNNYERKDGAITFIKRDTDAKMKEVQFKEGYLVKYEESFDSANSLPMTETFTISAREVTVGNGFIAKAWPNP